MKRSDLPAFFLFLASLLFPVCLLVARLLGYSLAVKSGLIFAGVLTACYHAVGILMLTRREWRPGKTGAVLLAVTLLLNQISALLFAVRAENTAARLLIASWFVMTAVLTAVCVKSFDLKAAFYALSGVLAVPVCLILLLSGLGSSAVLAREVSPGSTWCAEVIEVDKGAAGGYNILKVWRYGESFSVGSFDFRKDLKSIDSTEWGGFRSLTWRDDDHLLMNGTVYSMSKRFP